MAVLRFRKAAEYTETGKSAMWGGIAPGYMSDELTEDSAPNASSRQLPARGPITTNELAMKLGAADAAISTIQELLREIGTRHDELRGTLDDLKLDRDEWRRRAERAEQRTGRPWWRRLAG
jgi:hypothetical protein